MALLHLAGRRFPAVGLVIPTEGEVVCARDQEVLDKYPWVARPTLGDDRYGWYVACENGLLVEVDNNDDEQSLLVSLCSRHCALNSAPCGCTRWLPIAMGILSGRIVPSFGQPPAIGVWMKAEPEWVLELIDRVSVMPVDEPDGPMVKLMSVEDMRAQEP